MSRRQVAFARNQHLENLLEEVNSDLRAAEANALAGVQSGLSSVPVLLLGPPRSGSTLFLQWLANTGSFAYPSNLLARFYRTPTIGAKIARLLIDPKYAFRDELAEFSSAIDYESRNGKTSGVAAPNEFWYFWRQFLPSNDVGDMPTSDVSNGFDREGLVRALEGLTAVTEKPFAMKAMIMNHHVNLLDDILDRVVFVHIERDTGANAESLLDARLRQYGTEEEWYGFRCPHFDEILEQPAPAQTVAQVRSINRAVQNAFAAVRDERKLTVAYETFCSSPESIYDQLAVRLRTQGSEIGNYQGPASFSQRRSAATDPRIRRAMGPLHDLGCGD